MYIEFISENNEAFGILENNFNFSKKFSPKLLTGKSRKLVAFIEERGGEEYDSETYYVFKLENGKVYIQWCKSFAGEICIGYVYNWAKPDFNLEKFLAECREKLIERKI